MATTNNNNTKKKDLTPDQVKQVISDLLLDAQRGEGDDEKIIKTKHGAVAATAKKFSVHPSTISRIWKRARANYQDPNVKAFRASSQKKAKSGRKVKWDRAELKRKVAELEDDDVTKKRKSLRQMAHETGVPKSTLHLLMNDNNNKNQKDVIVPREEKTVGDKNNNGFVTSGKHWAQQSMGQDELDEWNEKKSQVYNTQVKMLDEMSKKALQSPAAYLALTRGMAKVFETVESAASHQEEYASTKRTEVVAGDVSAGPAVPEVDGALPLDSNKQNNIKLRPGAPSNQTTSTEQDMDSHAI